jgi:uncharacterized heparinase superfamily protein
MSLLKQARRYWHTVSYLRPSQAIARADLRLRAAWRRQWPARAAARYAKRAAAARFIVRIDPWRLRVHADRAAALMDPADRARVVADATARREGRFTFLHETAGGGDRIDWRAPQATQLWRYHLHYFDFLPEALACGESWASLAPILHDWIAANPLGAGHARDAWHSYVVSLRAVNWLLGAAIAPAVLEDARIRASLEAQIVFVERNLETDVGGNHLLKNLKALAIAGCLLDGAAAARLRARFVPAFTAALRAQLRSDGGHYEQSPMYHAQVLVDALEVALALRLSGDAVPGPLDEALAAMDRFLARVCHPDGQIAQFGDSAFNMTPPPAAIAVAVAAARGTPVDGSVAVRHAPFAAAIPAGATRPAPPSPDAPIRDLEVDLASSGAYVLATRAGDGFLIADAGPVCPDDLPAHAHADLFGFEVSAGGMRIVVDTGVSEYRAGPWRAYERSTRAHSTVLVDGVEQSDCWGSFRVAERARVVAVAAVDAPGVRGFTARHDGYERLGEPVRHTRQIALVADAGWLVVDVLEGRGTHAWETFLHLHPEVTLDATGPLAWRATRGGASLAIVAFGAGDPQIARGALDPPQGWYAPEFGRRLPAPVLRLTGAGPMPAAFGWLLALDAAAPAAVSAAGHGAWHVTLGSRQVTVPVRVP